MNKWPMIRFGEIYAEPSRNGLNRPKSTRGEGIKMVNMGELFAFNRISSQDMERVQMSELEQEKYCLKIGDLLFARQSLVAKGTGKCSITMQLPEPLTFESHIIRVRLDKKAIPLLYYYYFDSPQGKGNIQSLVMQVSAAGIRASELVNLMIPYPPLPTQSKVAEVLSAYDDLIENNLRRIKILEEMAQNLYREWFVNFRFPGHEKAKMVDSPLGRIPEGWELKRVQNIIKRIPAGKRYDNKTVYPFGLVPVLDQGRSGIIGYHNDSPTVYASEDKPVIVFANHTCYQKLVQFPFSTIQNVLPYVSSSEYQRDIYWLYYATKDLVKLNDYKGHWPEFVGKSLILPPTNECVLFGQITKPLVRGCYKLELTNNNLRQTRDLLLPKLISGELDISDLDIKVGEAA